MIAVVTVLLAFPLGYFVASRLAANTAYAIAYLWAFTFQAVYLLPMFLEDGLIARAEDGRVDVAETFPWDYGVVTLAIFLVGFGLVALGRWVRDRRGVRVPTTV